jgi:L-threonylcarbamoyladenylate synthase
MIGSDLAHAQNLLEQGELVAIPTETVYGLAGNAYNAEAVAKIFQVKNRPSFDPLIVHISEISQLEAFVSDIPPQAWVLAEECWPGPLTLLLPKKSIIPDLVTSGLTTVGVRIPDHWMARELLYRLDFPLAAPSANPFGYISPTSAKHVEEQLGSLIPYILDGGPCSVGVESTIVGFEEGKSIIYRKGGISPSKIKQLTSSVEVRTVSESNPLAPGMTHSHYAPRIPMRLMPYEEARARFPGATIGMLSFKNKDERIHPEHQVVLSASGDYAEAARNLFASMRYLDACEIDLIIAELLPEEDLGMAINDRLRRASAEHD